MKDRIKALLLASAMMVTLSSCKGNSLEESSSPTESISTNTIETDALETAVIESEEPFESFFVQDVVHVNTPSEIEEVEGSDGELDYISTEYGDTIESPRIQAELAKIEKGEPFQFTYVTGCFQISSLYDIMGPKFKQIEKDGKKCLVYANDEDNILLSGYDFLGLPFYIFGYDKANGGNDEKSKYSGWAIPTYTYTKGDSYWDSWEMSGVIPPKYTFDLYDFEDFHLLLMDCTPDVYFDSYGTDCFGTTGPIFIEYFSALDPKCWGHDTPNSAAGYAFVVKKRNTRYLVDANNFNRIYYEGFSGYESYGNAIIFKNVSDDNELMSQVRVDAHELEPYYSKVLTREREK